MAVGAVFTVDRHPERNRCGVIGYERAPVGGRIGVDHDRRKADAGADGDERQRAGEHRQAAPAHEKRRHHGDHAEHHQLAAQESPRSHRRHVEQGVQRKSER